MRSLIDAVSRRLQKRLLGPLPDDPRNAGLVMAPLSVNLKGRVVLITGKRCAVPTLTLQAAVLA